MEQASPGRRRRLHSEEFKTRAVQACKQPGVSMAAVALANGINANLLRRWVQAAAESESSLLVQEGASVGFIAVPMSAAPATKADPIRIELQRGATKIAVTWPHEAAHACAAWMRELLR